MERPITIEKSTKTKAIVYTALLILLGSSALFFSQSAVMSSGCILLGMIMGIIIYFDKSYRAKYLPTVHNVYLIAIIVLLLGLAIYRWMM